MDSLLSLPTTAYLLLGDTILFPLPEEGERYAER